MLVLSFSFLKKKQKFFKLYEYVHPVKKYLFRNDNCGRGKSKNAFQRGRMDGLVHTVLGS